MSEEKEISKLKINRTLKKYEYLKSEYDYINIISDDADVEFMEVVKKYLMDRPDLKEVYDRKERDIINDNFNKVKEISKKISDNTINESQPINNKKKSKKSKTLYREIVKKTHPDKVDDDEFLELYKIATDSYHNDDATSLYSICEKLNISFDISEDDLTFFDQNINKIEGEIELIKGMYSYKWTQAITQADKDKLIFNFISNKIK